MSASFPEEQQAESSAVSPLTLGMQLGWAFVVATVGGYLCGLVIDWVGEVGSISLWGLGALAGAICWKIGSQPNKLVAWSLVVATITAFLVAETFWIHWNIKQGAESLWTAASLLPQFFQEYKVSGFIGGIMTGFGAYSAYRQNA